MRLKSLEIQGYKSFASKVKISFADGITAVVGPNGSGKSNVADAIRWVLGEQSYGNLRGKKTEDMIFSGSDGRSRLGLAVVTLVLDNTDQWLPLDFAEVTIARRAYRSGDNEYYLNGSRVRLKDVAELLAKSGLRRQTYTVIGQGTIDRVLSLQAQERRALFEEAAGITFHRQKRAETLQRLEETHANVLRLNDIVTEIEPQLKRLEKQAKRAEEHARLAAELENLLRLWYGYRWGQAQQHLREAAAHLRENEATFDAQRHTQQQQAAVTARLKAEQTQWRTKLSGWHTNYNQQRTQAEAIQRELAVSQERATQYATQQTDLQQEIGPLEASFAAQQQHITDAETALFDLAQHLDDAHAELQAAQQRLDALQADRQALTKRQKAAAHHSRDLEAAVTTRQSRLAQVSERRETLLAERERYDTELNSLEAQAAQLAATHTHLTSELESLSQQLTSLEAGQQQHQHRLAEVHQAAEQLKTQLVRLERQADALKARQDVLGKLRNDLSGYYEGVRAVMQANLSGIIGPVSQLIHAPPDLEVAIEVALGGRLQDVVVECFADAEQAIQHLKQNRRGRATFLPLDTIRVGHSLDVPQLPGVVGIGADLVTVEPRLQPIAEFTLNRTLIVDNLPAARRAFAVMQGGFQLVTREGEVMRSGGAVTGGGGKGNRQGTLLAREREWREIPAQLAHLNQEHATLSSQLADHHEQADTLKREMQSLKEAERQTLARQKEVQSMADKVSRSIEQVQRSIGWQHDLRRKGEAELAQLDEQESQTQADVDRLTAELESARQSLADLTGQLEALSTETLMTAWSQAKTRLATLQTQHQNQQATLRQHQTAAQDIQRQIEAKQRRVETLAAEQQTLQQKQQALEQQQTRFTDHIGQVTAQIDAAETQLAALEKQQAEQEHIEARTRQRLQRLEAEHNRLALEVARRQDELDNLQRHIHEDLGLVNLDMAQEQVGQHVLPMDSVVSDLEIVETLPAGVEADVHRLKVQVRRLGNINADAPREYAELHHRHEFLTQQMTDLENAAANMKAIIAKLDESMQEAFTATFNKVAVEFQQYFKALFGGGEAKITLTEPENMVSTGIEVAARPPGKRLQSMALLSGGERSLTAQALIFALLRVSPTPFVIFDEVDAMLDEANVNRFCGALKGLARDIQFIIITHNRHTVETGDFVYGITMGDDSVSQVRSLNRGEWLTRVNGMH